MLDSSMAVRPRVAVGIIVAVVLIGGVSLGLSTLRDGPSADATRTYEVRLAGSSVRALVTVDPARGVVWARADDPSVRQFYITPDQVLVATTSLPPSATMEVDEAWVAWPLSALRGRHLPLTARELADALDVGVKRCVAPKPSNVADVVRAVLGDDGRSDEASLCDSRVGAAADDGEDLVVKQVDGTSLTLPDQQMVHELGPAVPAPWQQVLEQFLSGPTATDG